MRNSMYIGLYSLLLIVVSCQKQSNLTSHDNQLFSQLIDLVGHPLPPPPPSNDYDTIPSQGLVDSLSKIKLKIGIHPTVKVFTDKDQKCLNDCKQEEKSKTYQIELEKLHSEKGHIISLIDTTISHREQFAKYDIIVKLYKPNFSEDFSKAMVKLSVSRGTLSGFLTLVCLENEDNIWKITDSQELSIW